jgi:tRNA nucleotidyltransferase (CCA-adding enzyme)
LRTGAEVLEALRDQPGGPQLLELADGRGDVELVGGAVRDLLLGGTPRELDVVVADDAATFANELAHRLNALAGQSSRERFFQSNSHERFRTALVWWDGSRIDVATRRSERYPQPGALPAVLEGTPEEDLQRRDFTVNAVALPLGGAHRGELRAVPDALEDLSAGRLRVLHDNSFIDDPTRLFRLARYRARLGFTIEEHTADLAATAVSSRALDAVSRARIGAELRLALSEADVLAALASIEELGLLRALSGQLGFDEVGAGTALGLLSEAGEGTRPDLLLIAMTLLPPGYHFRHRLDKEARWQMTGLLDDLEFSAPDRDRVMRAVFDRQAITEGLFAAKTPADIYEVAALAPPEAVALAGLGFGPDERDNEVLVAARRWLTELRHIRLRITGEDLLAVGVPQGPEIGHRLNAALMRKLDGELADGRDAELAAALEASP